MPPVVAAVSAVATWYAGQALLVQFGIRVAIGFVISAAASQLLAKPKNPTAVLSGTGRQESVRQAAGPHRTLIGETLAGGTIAFVETHGGGNKMMSVLTIRAAHEVAGWEELFFGDEALTISGNDVTAPTHNRYTNRAWVYTHDGASDQVADSELFTRTGGRWTSNHRLRGLAYDHLMLRWKEADSGDDNPQNIWADFRLDAVSWRLRGREMYDPRDGATRYTNNPALAMRDYMVTKLGVTSDELNDTAISAAANICEEQVTLTETTQTFTASASTDVLTLTDKLDNLRRGNVVRVSNSGGALPTGLSAATDYYVIPVSKLGVKLASSWANAMAGTAIDVTAAGSGVQTLTLRSEPRYTANGMVEDTDQPGDVLRGLAAAMAGVLTYTGGKFEVHAGASATPVLDLTEDDLRGAIHISPRRSRQVIYNGVKASYLDPDQGYQPVTSPLITSATYIAQDGGNTIVHTIDLPFCDGSPRAQRLSKIDLSRCRQQIAVQFPCKLRGLQVKVWDVVTLTIERYGWDEKPFRVINWTMGSSGAPELSLAEESDDMWDWAAEDASGVDTAPDTNLPAFTSVTAPPTPISVTESLRATADETVVTVLTASVTPSEDVLVARYQFSYKPSASADSAYVDIAASPNTRVEIVGVEDGVELTIRCRAENWLGYVSSYITATYQPIGQSAKPAQVANLSVNIIGHQAVFSWDANTEVDLAGYRIKYNLATTGALWSNSIDLFPGGESGKPRISRNMVTATAPAGTGTYLIKAVDRKGNESSDFTAIVASVATLPEFNFIATATEDTAFSGTHDNTVKNGGMLQLGGADTLADWATLSSIAVLGLGDGAGFEVEGTYTFANKIDLGAVYDAARATSKLTVQAEDYGNLLSTWPTMAGVQQMGSLDPGDYDVTLQVRTTENDPASGGATWGGWRDFVVGDYKARGFHFRVRLRSFAPNVTPQIIQCRVNVDMPDRFEKGEDLALASGGTSVTFSHRFKVTPNVAVTFQNLPAGGNGQITAKSATGFTARGFTSAGAGVACTVDWRAQGY